MSDLAGFIGGRVADLLHGRRPEVGLQKGVAGLQTWYRGNRNWAKTIDTDD